MKKSIVVLAVLMSVSMGLSASNAHKTKSGARERKSPMKELNLTTDQQTQMQSLKNSYEAKRKDLTEAYRKDVEKILTPDQKTKWEAMQKQRAERRVADRKGLKKGKKSDTRVSKEQRKLENTNG